MRQEHEVRSLHADGAGKERKEGSGPRGLRESLCQLWTFGSK